MYRYLIFLLLAAALGGRPVSAAVWGADYFPDITLTSHDGERVRFFDLIEGKTVAINFIYTSCPDVCSLETAQLVKTQDILGEQLGSEVFFYSITIDPAVDTPEVLSDYRERFGARWTFLTGRGVDIIALRKKLGLYIAEIQDGSNNHNLNMVIGNQPSGRWMKRSPFENPHVLADQLGNWLSGWKTAGAGHNYAGAPKLRRITTGERLFRSRCAGCHSVSGAEPAGALGPDLAGVVQRRELGWLLNWLRAPDQVLAANDPIATALYRRYNRLAMPNLGLNQEEALALIEYIDDETRRLRAAPSPVAAGPDDLVAVANAWVREPHPGAEVCAGYLTLINLGSQPVTVVGVESEAFDQVMMHEMAVAGGVSKMRPLAGLSIPAGAQVRLAPGGKHLMLKGPRKRLSADQTVKLTLVFQSGRRQTVTAKLHPA